VIQKGVAALPQKDENASQTWALPVLGMFAMLAMFVGGGAVARRRRRTGIREVRTYQDVLIPDVEADVEGLTEREGLLE
jgi:hypothetical protein